MDETDLPLPPVRCLSKEQAAVYLGIGVTLLAQLRVPCICLGRRRVYDRVDLDAWLDEHKGERRRAGKEALWPDLKDSTGDGFGLLVDQCNAPQRPAHTPERWD